MDTVMRRPHEENKGKENNLLENVAGGSPAMTSAEVCSTKKNKGDRRQESRCNAIESNGNIFGVPKDTFSIETSVASLAVPQQHPAQRSVDPVMSQSQVENIAKEKNVLASASDGSPAMTSAEISLRKKDKRKRRQENRRNAIESNGNISGVSEDTFSTETFKAALATPLQHPAQHSVDPAMRQSLVENAAKEKNALENALDGSPAMTSAEGSFRKKNKRKRRWKRRKNAIVSNVNLPGVSKDTFSTETPLAALAVPPQNPAQHSVDPAMRQPQVENATKEKNMLENASDGSPALTSTDVILINKDKRKRRQENRHNIVSNENLSVVPIFTFSTETSSAALSLPLQYSAEHSVGPVAGQSQVKNAVKEKKVLENVMDGCPVMTSTELSLTKKNKRKRRRKQRHNAIESNGDLSGVPKDTFSTETFGTAALAMPSQHPDQFSLDPVTRQSLVENANMEKNVLGNATDKSPAMTSVEVSLRKKNKGRQGEKRHNAIESNDNLSCVPKDTFSTVHSTAALAVSPQHPARYSVDPVTRLSQAENDGKENNVLEDATYGLPALTNVEVSSRKKSKKRKRKRKTRHNDIETNVNVSDVPIDNFSSQTSPPTLDMPTQHPGEYSMDPVMRQPTQNWALDMLSQQPAQFLSMEQVMRQSQDENEGKEHNMLGMGSESSNGEHKLEIENSNHSSVVAYAVNFLRGFISEVIRLSTVQGEIADLSLVSRQDDCSVVSHFPLGRSITCHSKKKLLVLDLNGLLADFVPSVPEGYTPHEKISGKAVFKRPFCDDFLQFCFDRFHVGIWSSRKRKNVYAAIRFLVGESASKLLFSWNLHHCTRTKFKTIKNEHKPLVLKELRKLWEKLKPGLPWEKGEFNESNTLLLDDSPYKALRNPMHTAIFPYPYQYSDANDTSIGPGGDLRVYLEGLAMAENVQEYVASHPFGQPAITESDPNWDLYRRVIGIPTHSRHNATTSNP